MLVLDTLDVSAFNIQDPALTWTFEATDEALSGYSLSVYRSESPDDTPDDLSAYDLIASGVSPDDYAYTDTTQSGLYHHNRTWFYRLLISGIGTANTSIAPVTPAYNNDTSTFSVWREILRRKQLVLERTDDLYAYIDLHLIKRRTWGTHCTLCWDTTLNRATDGDCSECYGTGWTSGYFNAISFKGMVTSSPKMNQINMFGEWMPSDVLLYMLNFPPLHSKDIVVAGTGDRYVVVGSPRQIRVKNIIIEQQAQLALIHADDPTYAVTTT